MNGLVKTTGYPLYWLCFRTKTYYENKSIQSRKVKGPAVIVSNHTSVYDYAVMVFTFYGRTLHYLMAEVLFQKKGLGWFLKSMGGIHVNRYSFDMGFIRETEDVLRKKGVVGIFPEARLPRPEEERPLEFKASAVLIALYGNAPIIPVYTNGSYFNKKRARVVIGTPIDVSELYDDDLGEKENLVNITKIVRERVIKLGEILDEE